MTNIYYYDKIINKKEISLKEEFFANDENCPIDLKIKVITLTDKNNILNEYIKFTKCFDKNVKIYGYTKECISKTLKECIDNNILKEYLEERKKEVYKIMRKLLK